MRSLWVVEIRNQPLLPSAEELLRLDGSPRSKRVQAQSCDAQGCLVNSGLAPSGVNQRVAQQMASGISRHVQPAPSALALDSRCKQDWHHASRSGTACVPQLSLHTPVGDVTLAEEEGAIVSLDWGWGRDQSETALLLNAREQLEAYFDGDLHSFALPLAPVGSAYRQAVWQALRDVPYGSVRSYRDIALHAGGSARSVGQANSQNPIPLIIPCHRVVAMSHLGGYSGGEGVSTKRWLLNLENPDLFLL